MKRGLFIFVLLSCVVLADNYYVTNSGSGDGSKANPWGVTQFNSLTGNYAGDTFFFSGNFDTEVDISVSGSPGNPVILDGYEPDDITFMDLTEESGRALFDFNSVRSFPIETRNVEYVTIQDFEMTGTGTGGGISVREGSKYIVIKRNFIHDDIHSGISMGNDASFVTIGGSLGQGNVIKNIGADTGDEDIALGWHPHDVIISYNHLYGEGQRGIDGVMVESGSKVLIEYNTIHGHNNIYGHYGEDGIDLKKDDTTEVIIRYNNIYDHDYQTCVTVQSGSDHVYVYGNRCSDSVNGLLTGDDPNNDEVYFFSNIVYDIEEKGIQIGAQGSAGNVQTYNNLVAESGICADYTLFDFCRVPNHYDGGKGQVNYNVGSVDSLIAKNNIFYKNNPYAAGNYPYRMVNIIEKEDTSCTFDNNIYYWPGQESKIYWGDAGDKTLEGIKTGSGNGLPQEINSRETNPGLVDIEGNNYRVDSVLSAAFGSGLAMGTGTIAVVNIHGNDYPVYWDDALHPDTDWTTIPPTVIPARQSDFGQWEIGPYVFDDGVSSSCSDMGFYCCLNTCNNPVSGNNCAGVCCASESDCIVSEVLQPGINIEAEAGEITAPMRVDTDSTESYIHTLTDHQGTAEFLFNITEPGSYYLQARIIAPTIEDDSFYCFLDDETLQDENYDSWDTIEPISWTWVNVTKRGDGGIQDPEFNPMVWQLDQGLHTFTIQGRETGTLLDKIMLKPMCTAPEIGDIVDYVTEWLNGDMDMIELIDRINRWRDGC